nr:MAG: hypothetical protein 2 [Leviviridae sp.]
MFNETQTVAIDGVNYALTRINNDGYSSEYYLRGSTQEHRIRVRNSTFTRKGTSMKVDRHSIELTNVIFGAVAGDPPTTRKAYIVFENEAGDDVVDFDAFVTGFCGYVATDPLIAKALNFES